MERMSIWLKYYVAERLQTSPLWKGLKIIYSDSSIPGEGEHKVLDFIRSQRNSEGYDPNLSHWIYGADADLIMLGLSTHEPRFYIIREVFVPPHKRRWAFCQITGHDLNDCEAYKRLAATSQDSKPLENPVLFQYIKIHTLREYLGLELEVKDDVHNDVEKKIDDFIFLCFFVGNDFLPHLPSFRIRNGAIDLILSIYKHYLPKMSGYLTNNCKLNMSNIQFLLSEISKVEEDLGQDHQAVNVNSRHEQRGNRQNREDDTPKIEDEVRAFKDKSVSIRGDWRLSYYQNKFHVEKDDMDDFLAKISKAYLEGINWVYSYYYTGCPSWEWFYPYHYSPLAVDLARHVKPSYEFSKGKPYNPMEQLMSVLPKQSSHALPACLRPLLSNPQSDLIDFYPINFSLDLNGFKQAWMGVNLLPIVNENRLLSIVREKENEFSESDKRRNKTGWNQLIFNSDHINSLHETIGNSKSEDFSYGLSNKDGYWLTGVLKYINDPFTLDIDIGRPNDKLSLTDIKVNKVETMEIDLPMCDVHKWYYLEGVRELMKEVTQTDLMQGDRRTFLSEASIRVLESKLGIQRDPTLTYQNSYGRGRFSSGYYNDSAMRGGHNNHPTGFPVKRRPEIPTYQLGTRTYDNNYKRSKHTENQFHDSSRSIYDPHNANQNRHYPSQTHHYGHPPHSRYMGNYSHQPRSNYNYEHGRSHDNRQQYHQPHNPTQQASIPDGLRPPQTTQYSSFDRSYTQDNQKQRKRDKKADYVANNKNL